VVSHAPGFEHYTKTTLVDESGRAYPGRMGDAASTAKWCAGMLRGSDAPYGVRHPQDTWRVKYDDGDLEDVDLEVRC
jgi:hypothetical protein